MYLMGYSIWLEFANRNICIRLITGGHLLLNPSQTITHFIDGNYNKNKKNYLFFQISPIKIFVKPAALSAPPTQATNSFRYLLQH